MKMLDFGEASWKKHTLETLQLKETEFSSGGKRKSLARKGANVKETWKDRWMWRLLLASIQTSQKRSACVFLI